MVEHNDIDELITKSQNDVDSLKNLYILLRDDVFSLAFSILRDFGLSEDVTQETFIRLHYASKRYVQKGYGKSFVLKITRNTALEVYRHNKRQIPLEDIHEEFDRDQIDQNGNFDNAYVEQILTKLNLRERQIVMLHVFSDMTFDGIAKVLIIPNGTVKWLYRRALNKLKEYIEIE